MTELLRKIVRELGKEPFKKSFTVISFDSLKPEQLLQILNDVLAEIDPSNRGDVREQDPEAMVIRILNMLRILKYNPPLNDPSSLRSGIVSGSPKIIHPILVWLLPRIEELKVRAYLGRFLVKIEVPQDIRADIEVEELYQQYEERIEQFKSVHKSLEELKRKGFTTSEIRKDISAMESEAESVARKIERLKLSVESTPSLPSTLPLVQEFRLEKEKSRDLSAQHVSQNALLNAAEQRSQRLLRQLKELQTASASANAEGLLTRLAQDVQISSYIVAEKLPKEIETVRKGLGVYEKILGDSSLTPKDFGPLRERIEGIKSEINELVLRRLRKAEDPSLLMYRQQGGIVGNKKEALLSRLGELRTELSSLQEEERERKGRVGGLQGEALVKEEDFKEYVKVLRGKSTRYKGIKGELAYLKGEGGVLSKTIFILEEQLKGSLLDISALEARLGIKGYANVQGRLEKVSTEKGRVDEGKRQNLQQMSATVKELHERISEKKVDLAPLVKNLNGMRQQAQILGHEHDTLKRRWEGLNASVQSSLSSVLREVESLRKKSVEDQLRYAKLVTEAPILKMNIQRVREELRNYAAAVAASAAGDRRLSYKEGLLEKIEEQERLGKGLKEEEKEMAALQGERSAQTILWRNLLLVLQVKRGLKGGSQRDGVGK